MPGVAKVRGAGLLIGIGLHQPVAPAVMRAALERGLIVNAPNDTSIRLAPPLIIGDDHVAEFTTLFRSALEAST